MIYLVCEDCDKEIEVKDELAGRCIRCPRCAYKMRVPGRRLTEDKPPALKKPPPDETSSIEPSAIMRPVKPVALLPRKPVWEEEKKSPRPEPVREEEEKTSKRPPPLPVREAKEDQEEEPMRRPLRDEEDERPRRRPVRDEDEEEEDRPRRRRSRRDDDGLVIKKKKAKPGYFARLYTKFRTKDPKLQLLVVVSAVSLSLSCIHPLFVIIPVLLSIGLMILSSLLFLLVLVNDSLLELVLCLFVPFYNILYTVTHWEEAKVPFLLGLYSMVLPFLAIACTIPSAFLSGTFNRMAQDGAPNQPGIRARAAKGPVEKITGDEALDDLLVDLESTDVFVRKRASEKLAAMPPNQQHRKEVVARLTKMVRGDSPFFRDEAAKAIMAWGTKEDIPLMIELLGDKAHEVRKAILTKIGKFKDERTVKPVVNCFTDFFTEGPAIQALHDLGPMAEPEVLRLLDDKNPMNRGKAIDVLRVIGTRRSIPILQAISTEKGGAGLFLKKKAEDAIAAIQARGV